MSVKRAVLIGVLTIALLALAVPLIGLNAKAANSAQDATISTSATKLSMSAVTREAELSRSSTQQEIVAEPQDQPSNIDDKISPETLKALGIQRVTKDKLGAVQGRAAQKISSSLVSHITPLPAGGRFNAPSGAGTSLPGPPLVGQPVVLNVNDALSAALITTIGGRDNQFSEVALVADWDGREDCVVDRGVKVADFSGVEPIDFSLTRAAISEHTRGNGHPFFNVYYYGDSVGNVYAGVDLTGTALVDIVFAINIPSLINTGSSNGFSLLNPTAGDCTDDQVTVTGIAVNPVADLGDFDPALCGVVGEVVYISVFDSESCASNNANQPIRTRILQFGLTEGSDAGGGFIQFTNVRQVLRSKFANIAGISVDDDGSLYYQLVDLIQFTGGAIFKATEVCRTVSNCQGVVGESEIVPNKPGDVAGGGSNRINRVITSIPDPPTLNSWINTTATPPTGVVISGGSRHTNYGGGSSTLYGNIVALTNGGCNVLYAAVSRSFVAGDVSFEQLTEGLFPAPSQFGVAGTPSMVISFADCSGAFDVCSGMATGSVSANVGGTLPVADGFADVAQSGTRIPGVNNFRIFVQGNGPNLAPPAGSTGVMPGTPSNLLKVDMQIDYTAYSGLAVNEQNTVFVISGGTPAGIGKNPSPMLGEVLCFEDACPADRRADSVDLRGDALPNPPASGGNAGDGDSDRFDHIFYQSPLDQLTLTPAGLAGLADGFLRYTNRLVGTNPAAIPLGPGVALGSTLAVLGDDDTTEGAIVFENLDPGHQVAGGDDQDTPFRGDDNNGAGIPGLQTDCDSGVRGLQPCPDRRGGFEFVFGRPASAHVNCVWNGVFWNSDGNITLGIGDTEFTPTVPAFRSGLPRIAPAWTDLNPDSRLNVQNPGRGQFLCTFPVQALGFANVNAFKIRWINVPQFGAETCTADPSNFGGASNTFSVTLFDDGAGIDENANEALNPANPIGNNSVPFDLQEGPTDLRFTREPNTQTLVGCPPRPEGSGIFIFDYCRMDLLGAAGQPVITGFSIGGLDPLNPPGLCEINLSKASAAAEAPTFGVLPDTNGQTATICANCCIGEGTEPTLFELFNEGLRANTGSGGEVTLARPDFDLRFEGNDASLCTSARQRDLNRGRVCFLGVGCAPPANPICTTIVPGTFVTTPTTTGIVNALCAVQLNVLGCGFFPNETTTICQGFTSDTGIPLQRPGKTVTTAATLACDTNGDGVAESVITLAPVTPVNCNLVRATIPVGTSFGAASTSGFPAICCGGSATVTVTTSFSTGDNNVFGAFTRTSSCPLALGTRAPVVISVTPSSGPCGRLQDVLITGSCFTFTQAVPGTAAPIIGAVSSVFAVDVANPANRINAQDFTIINANLLDAHFNFGSANAGKTFVIFVTGPGGTSRGLTTPVPGQPAGCALGNEQGCLQCITFTCNASSTPGTGGTPEIATVTSCKLDRQETGQFFLDVTGTGIKEGATATVGGVTPKKIKVVEVQPGTTNPTKLRLVKKVCNGLPGAVIITNPGPNGGPSQPFTCTDRCPAQ